MDKENKNGDGTGEAARPGAELTREQIMAQRAEAKKLKAARKNKSGAGGGGGGNAAAATPPVAAGGGDGGADKKEKPGKEKKPQQQQQQQPPPPLLQAKHNKGRAPDIPSPTKENKAPEEPQKKVEQQVNRPPKEKTPPQKGKEASPPKSGEKQAVPATPTPAAQVEKVGSDGVSKSETPERSIPGSKGASEFQSRIQSLFQVKKCERDSGKSKNFQMHPLFHSLGVKLRHNVIRGTNHRCIALLNTLKEYVGSYQTPHGQSFKHGLSSDLRLNLDALREKCPFAIGMENAVEFLNAFLYKMEQDVRDVDQQKEEIQQVIYQYIEEKIEKAVEAIVIYGMEKITTGDVIMIYSVTEAVISLLEKAVQGEGDEKKTFELILIQTPETLVDLPALLKKLSEPIKKREIIISSVIFPNAIYRMRHCTKLIIGGHGLFTTGGVMAQSGSAELALLASTYNKPTIFLCETYKFCDRSPLDFFTLDEYIPEQSVTEEGLFQPKIRYDVTPANLVTVVVTDIDLLPSTSVPVVLRTRGIE